MSVSALVARGRRRAEALMADECTIRPVTGQDTDPDSGEVTFTYGDPVYSGKCKIQNQRLRYPETPAGGQHEWTTAVTEIHLPVTSDAGDVEAGHVVEIDSSDNSSNEGRRLRVESTDVKTHQTAIRLVCEEVLA
ncbi:MAG: DUF6093 family protein [Actinomycetota bacterium]